MQFVNLVERGERAADVQAPRRVRHARRAASTQIGVDAARLFMLQRSHDTTIDLDLDLARAQSSENPVYYVQYAHARIASMLRKAGRGELRPRSRTAAGLAHELEPAERALVKKLLTFPDEVAEATERRAPHRIAAYALELAQVFTRLLPRLPGRWADDAVQPVPAARCAYASQRTIARALDLLGVSAPQKM